MNGGKVKSYSGIKKNNFIYLFIFGYAGSLMLHGLFSSCEVWELLSSCGTPQASLCGGFSCCAAWALGHSGFSSCRTLTQYLRLPGSTAVMHGLSCSTAIWDLPRPEIDLCLLHWQADSLPISHQRSPLFRYLKTILFLRKKSGREIFLASDQQFCYCVNQIIFNLLCQEIIRIILSPILQLGTPEVKSLFSYRYGKQYIKYIYIYIYMYKILLKFILPKLYQALSSL